MSEAIQRALALKEASELLSNLILTDPNAAYGARTGVKP